jgi:YD repeat-containing protein
VGNLSFQITQIINESTLNTIAAKSRPYISDWTLINNLRSNTQLKEAQITTFKYKPLVGMTSSTDPAGISTYYDYDTFGRLKETYIIENGLKKTVQSYIYKYATQ